MYTTKEAMVNKFGHAEVLALTERGTYVGVIVDEVLDAAIIAVSGEIDSYIGSRYATPLTPVPVILTQLASDMVRYYLTGAAATETNPIVARYNNAVKFLKSVAKGEVTLGGMPNQAGVAPTTANTVHMVSGGRVFERGSY